MQSRCQVALVLCAVTVLAIQVCIGKPTIVKRDTAYQTDAKKTIEKTLGTWQGGIEKFFHDGIKVDQDVGFMSHNVHEFTSNIAEVGNMFVHTLHKPPSPERISAYSERAKNMSMPAKLKAPLKILQKAPGTPEVLVGNQTLPTISAKKTK